MRFALDSNIIIYAEGLNDAWRRDRAADIIGAIPAGDILIPIQAAGEAFLALVSRSGLPKTTAIKRLRRWVGDYRIQETNGDVFENAIEIVERHSFRIWDSIILAAAQAGGAGILLSEDMQDGFKWRGVTIINPFVDHPAPIITRLLSKN